MKINLETLANSLQSVRKLSTLDLGDPKTNFKFMGVVDTAETEAQKYEKLRRDILEKYGSKNGSNSYSIPVEKQTAFYKDIEALGTIEIELDWDIIACPIASLRGFTADDMKCINGKFINIVEGE